MSTCEKCWLEACKNVNLNDVLDISDEYHRLLEERRSNPCTPEEQAGPEEGLGHEPGVQGGAGTVPRADAQSAAALRAGAGTAAWGGEPRRRPAPQRTNSPSPRRRRPAANAPLQSRCASAAGHPAQCKVRPLAAPVTARSTHGNHRCAPTNPAVCEIIAPRS